MSFFCIPLVCCIRSICNICLRLFHSFIDWYLVEFFRYVSICTLGTKIEFCVEEWVACWCWLSSFLKCSFNGWGSFSFKKPFINVVFCINLYSQAVSVFLRFYIYIYIYIYLKGTVSGRKLIVLSALSWSSPSFLKWSDLNCSRICLAYIRCKLKSVKYVLRGYFGV